MPLLLLLLTGLAAIGTTYNHDVVLTEATAVGARTFAAMRGQGGDPCAVSTTAIAQSASTLTSASLTYAYKVNGTTYKSSSPSCSNATLTSQQPVQVTVTYPCSLVVYNAVLATNCMLTAQTTELIQ